MSVEVDPIMVNIKLRKMEKVGLARGSGVGGGTITRRKTWLYTREGGAEGRDRK